MRKPRNYDSTAIFGGGYEAIPNGNYKMRICRMDETTAKTSGAPMLQVWLDVAEGEHKGRYQREYDANSKYGWGMVFNVMVEDKDGNCHRALKTFINAVAESNRGFDEDIIWDDHFCDYFMGCALGASIRREEYINQKGENKWVSRVKDVFPVAEIDTRAVPADKPLESTDSAVPSYMRQTAGAAPKSYQSQTGGFAGYQSQSRYGNQTTARGFMGGSYSDYDDSDCPF